jgi:malonyl CoA-acyl carrier protein transacylase
MQETIRIAIVGLGAILPDAPDVPSFWTNIKAGRYSVTEVPAERWKPAFYFDPDPSVPDKTYSKIGGWVRGFKLNAARMGIAIPPRILEQIDEAQQWSLAACHQALRDYGYPERPLDPERVAVILGNALGGENHYHTTMRIYMPEYLDVLRTVPAFRDLPESARQELLDGIQKGIHARIPAATEDTMPGELSNVIAGRVANVFNFSGPNYVTDAACASSLAALQAAVDGLAGYKFDAVLTGGVDRNMGPEAFVKFCKIGALSADGSRPYAEGANGFVMGEGAAIFLLKRLEDAERDGDRIYAVIRGIGGSSDGKGKGITAPNPLGQRRAIERAWKQSALPPQTVGLMEGHGTSTAVGDVVEVGSMDAVFGPLEIKPGSVALGSVKSNFGHLKSAAGAAGLLKTTLALHDRILPPSVNFNKPNSRIDFSHLPFYVNTQAQPWEVKPGEVRRAGLSAFGFGGTNFHVVVEEYLPGVLTGEKVSVPGVNIQELAQAEPVLENAAEPYRGLVFLGAEAAAGLGEQLATVIHQAKLGHLPANRCPTPQQLALPERLVIEYENGKELIGRGEKALKALESDTPANWLPLGVQGITRGSGRPGKVAFLFPGQGSQYINMLRDLRKVEPLVAETFREADAVMTPILGRPLTGYVFVDGNEDVMAQAELKLRHTDITQPALLAVHVSLLRVLGKFGYRPDMVIGHSLGEYAALVAAGVLTLSEALQVVSARGQEMTRVTADDTGCMAAVSAPLAEVERILKTIDGYVVIANINSPVQCVIGGNTPAVDAAVAAFLAAGLQATKIPVSHAFHTRIVEPASGPLRQVIARMNVQTPKIPIVANVTGQLYPSSREQVLDLLAAQVASPVQFVQGIRTLYEQGARIFVEVGPKRVLSGLATDILKEYKDVTVISTNHPRKGDLASINEALARLYAAGVGAAEAQALPATPSVTVSAPAPKTEASSSDGRLPLTGSVVISGAGLGLPGRGKHVFEDDNIQSILKGEMRIEPLPEQTRQSMLDRRPVRLVKSEAGAVMQPIDDMDQTLKLGGQRGIFDLGDEFGIPQDRLETIDISTQLAIAAGIEALRDAGIPLVMAYKQTSTGSFLPDRWKLPEALADETGIIFCSAFPGLDRMAEEAESFYDSQAIEKQIAELRRMAAFVPDSQEDLKATFAERIAELEAQSKQADYHFDRRYIFRILTMGHSQFAEYIGARGPNTHVNAACASTTHAVAIAEDWIRSGRARRVVIVAGDDVISGSLSQWVATSLMASGAATTEGDLRMAALPFDRRRNGMIIGMGAAGLVVEAQDALRERGMRAICEVLSTQIANSAYHGTRLNVGHVSQVMERLLATAEARFGIGRSQIAPQAVFVSHETYTPARGGSAAAEIHALRSVFAERASQVIIANTKGFTGHTMGVGVEDVVAVKALEFGRVPPIAYIQDGFEPDPELGDLNLSRGGEYPLQYSLRLGAGFGSQIAMTLLRKIPGQGSRVESSVYSQWLDGLTGYPSAETEIVNRTLRVKDLGAPSRPLARSAWQYGQGPTVWVAADRQDPVPVPVPSAAVAALPVTTSPRSINAGFEEIKAHLLSLVSEKTGYPVEVLELELDLEADLGIDTVKQAELFAAMREQHGIPRREDLRLADYNTLAKVIAFVEDSLQTLNSGQPAPAGEAAPVTATEPPAIVLALRSSDEIQSFVQSLVSEKTGYPVEVLDLDLDLEADLGIDTVKQAELFASVREQYGIPRREDLRLADYNTLAKVIGFVEESLRAQPAPAPVSAVSDLQEAPVAAPAAFIADGAVKNYVLSLVSEKTGYPLEVLDLELDLEADLGIDTVKQAELFAAVRAEYNIPRREVLRLADYNTLAKVIAFAESALQEPALPAQPIGQDETPGVQAEAAPVVPSLVDRRVPVPALRARAGLCLLTGVELGEGSRILVLESGKQGETLARKLRARKAQVCRVDAGQELDAIKEKIAAFRSEGEIQGMYFLPALEVEADFERMTSDTWQSGLRTRTESLLAALQSLPETAFLVCATRMGGFHGYAGRVTAPMGGAVSGFAKATARERSGAFVKVVDFEADASPALVASALIEETLRDPGAVEIGREGGLRYGIATIARPRPAHADLDLKPGSVFLVSGGSSGIIGPIATELARVVQGTFYLLVRTPVPSAEEQNRLAADRDGLKKEVQEKMKSAGRKATPLEVEHALEALERAAEVAETIRSIERLGGKAFAIPCDVSDAQHVEQAVDQILAAEGHVDVFLHAAGVERSRKLPKKSVEEFRQTFSAKADGFFHVFRALEKRKSLPAAMVFFTSIAGRYGNSGQTDYSAANDLLCKIAYRLAGSHPDMKTLALDWGAWSGVGMASRGNIPALMEMAGISMLEPSTGAALLREELLASRGEVVLAGSLGGLSETPAADSLDLKAANQALRAGKPLHTMLSQATGFDLEHGLKLEVDLDPQDQPFLHDHVLNGTPVLPGVMGIEGFTLAARHIGSVLASGQAGLTVSRLEDVQFLTPFKFYRKQPRHVTWNALAVREKDGLVVHVSMESTVIRKFRPAERVLHFSGKVHLARLDEAAGPVRMEAPRWNGAYTVKSEEIYKLFFHGPAFQVLEGVQRSGDVVLGKLRKDLPMITRDEHELVSTPTLVELCFQTAGLWEAGKTGILALPRSICNLSLYPQKVNGSAIYAQVRPVTGADGSLSFDARVLDEEGRLFLELEEYRTSPFPYSTEKGLLQPLEQLVREA